MRAPVCRMACGLAASALLLAANLANAGVVWESYRNNTSGGNNNDPLNFTTIVNGVGASGLGWSLISGDYLDYFNGSDTAEWTNVPLPSLTTGQALVVQARRGNTEAPQGFRIELWNAGSGFSGSPVSTLTAAHFRKTNWGGSGTDDYAWSHGVAIGSYTPGNYDIRITSLDSTANPEFGATVGSHLRGLGVRTYAVFSGPSTTVEAENFAFYSNTVGLATAEPANANSVAGWLDNKITGSNWADYQLFNPSGAPVVVGASAFVRHNMGGNATLTLSSVDQYGNVSALTTVTIPSTGWAGTPFFDRLSAGTFVLQPGLNTIRLSSDIPIHIDSFTLAVPEPATASMLLLAATGMLRRRRAA